MAEARRREAWSHTSAVLALIANVNRDPRRVRAFGPEDFNPFAPARTRRRLRGIPIRAGNIRDLKVFVKP